MAYSNFWTYGAGSFYNCPPCGFSTEVPCTPQYAYPYSWDYGHCQQQCVGLPPCFDSGCCVYQGPIGVPITPLTCTSIHHELPQQPPIFGPVPVPQPPVVYPTPVQRPRLTINPLKLELDKAWNKFKSKYRPCSVMDVETEKRRKQMFCRNYLRIKEQNEKYRRGETSYQMGINDFSDWVSFTAIYTSTFILLMLLPSLFNFTLFFKVR